MKIGTTWTQEENMWDNPELRVTGPHRSQWQSPLHGHPTPGLAFSVWTTAQFLTQNEVWWIAFGWLQDIHPAPLTFPLLKRAGGEKKVKFMGWDRDREITYCHMENRFSS